jgi:hypothetical protein
MGRLFDIIEGYRRRYEPHKPSYSRVAAELDVSRQTLMNWREPAKLIDKEHLIAVSRLTGVAYQTVRDALLEDIGYLHPGDPEPSADVHKRA